MTWGRGALAAARTAESTPVNTGELGRNDAGRIEAGRDGAGRDGAGRDGRDDVEARHVPDCLSLTRGLLALMLARRQPAAGANVQ